MSAAFQPDPRRTKRDRPASALLRDALTEQAKAKALANRSPSRAEWARQRNAEQLLFPWITADGREADMSVYYEVTNVVTVLADELNQIDNRAPTARERLQYEEEFSSEMEAAGDTWDQVASYIWERVR
jgi:hypothetical protein